MDSFLYKMLTENKENAVGVESYSTKKEERRPLMESNVVENRSSVAMSQAEYKRTKLVGAGSFGNVFQVVRNEQVYAMKSIKKTGGNSEMERLETEKYILGNNRSPFLCKMIQSFETSETVYIVLEFLHGGDFCSLLQREKSLKEDIAMFYIAQILLALEHLHDHWVIYRDLKPNNIMIDRRGYLKLTDFGLSKLNLPKDQKTSTICGTLEYNAPEQVKMIDYNHSVDIWALGVVMFEMVTGREPFIGYSPRELMMDIVKRDIDFPENLSWEGKILLQGLLTKAPENRISISDAKSLDFFAGLNWQMMAQQGYEAPLRPIIEDVRDVSNFDPRFTSQAVEQSPVKRNPFDGFDFDG